MTQKRVVTSDISKKDIDYDGSYGLTVTNRSTKMSAKFDVSHDEAMKIMNDNNLRPNWESWGNFQK